MIDSNTFRETLGHFPTGVVVVTTTVDGEPLGMVVGSFTSVSLDPPLVAYLPARTSSSYAKLGASDTFCVNVLAASQEALCRQFASRTGDKYAGVAWHPSELGSPILDEAASLTSGPNSPEAITSPRVPTSARPSRSLVHRSATSEASTSGSR